MIRRLALFVGMLSLALVSCGSSQVEPTVSFDGEGCSSSDVRSWPSGSPDIEVSNNTETGAAVVMGTYADGFGHDDLVAYGSDVSTRPVFMDALEIFQVAAGSTTSFVFDHGPGTFFLVCMPDSDTMVVLDDVSIEN